MIVKYRTAYLVLILSLIACIVLAAESTWTRIEGGSWQPSDQIMSKIKANLETHMKSKESVFRTSLKKWDTYRFQYQGQEKNNRRFVYINAFCDFDKDKNLSKVFIFVLDGGSCYFQVKYDPIADIFFDISINGEA
jgi:hypothetical protein